MTKTTQVNKKNPGHPVVKQVVRKVQRMMLKVEGMPTMKALAEYTGGDPVYIDAGELIEWLREWDTTGVGKK